MRTTVILILFAALSAAPAWAAEPPVPEKPPQTAPAKPAEQTPAPSAEQKPASEESPDAKQAEQKPDAKPAGDAKASPQRFIPSEQVRADFDVSFPIDI